MLAGPGEGGKGCSSTHPCCGAGQGAGPGCREVCRKCGGDWGTAALQVRRMVKTAMVACVSVFKFQCFRRDHDTCLEEKREGTR